MFLLMVTVEMFIPANVLAYLGKNGLVGCMYDKFKVTILKFNYDILCRLGQACNQIAALLFYIEYYADAESYQLIYQRRLSLWLGTSHLKRLGFQSISAKCNLVN